MHSVLFHIGSFAVNSYGACVALGLIAAITLLYYRAEKFGLNTDLIFNGGLIAFFVGMIGAKLLYIIVEHEAYLENPKLLLNFGSGFVAYGGIITGIIAFAAYFKIKKANVMDYMELAAPALALGQAFGRIGCLMAGCCYGAAAPEGAWYAITFPAGCEAPANIGLYPVQIWGALLDLALCLLLVFLNYREKFCGFCLSLYLMLYSVGRFMIEFLRDDPRGSVGPLSTSQFIAIFTFAAGAAMFFIFRSYGLRPVKVGGHPEDIEEDDEEDASDFDMPEDIQEEEKTESVPESAETENEDEGFEKMIYDDPAADTTPDNSGTDEKTPDDVNE